MEGVDVMDGRRRARDKAKRGEERKGSKAWIMRKKEQMEKKGRWLRLAPSILGEKKKSPSSFPHV